MARIHCSLAEKPVGRVYDTEGGEGYPGLRHAWIDLRDHDGSEVCLSMSYGLSTDAEIVAATQAIIAAAAQLLIAAQERIAARQSTVDDSGRITTPLPDGLMFVGTVGQFLGGIGSVAGLTPDDGDHFVRTPA